jgi:hypothetical protein
VTETTIDLTYAPRPWQRTVHNSLKRFSVLVAHRRSGKTVLAIMTLMHAALKTTKQNARFAYVAPYRGQAKDVAWKYLKQYALKVPHTTANEGELWVELPNGAQIRLYGADNPDSLRGIYLDGVVMDEVADMRPDVWGEIIRPALSDRMGWALFIGTPKGMNLFSEVYYSAQGKDEWYAGLFTCYDTDALPPSEIEAMKASMSEDQFAQELLCSFEAGNSSTLLSMSVIEEACKRELREGQYSFAAKILGVDVARQGDDSTCIFRRQGLAAFDPKVFKGLDAMAVAAHVAKECDEWQPDAVFIDGSGGYGAGVIDRLRQLGYVCTEVQFGGRPTDDRYSNKRTEMWMTMADWVKAGGALPNRASLKLDLSAPTYNHKNASGKMALESKDQIKARGLPSPDEGDAMALTFAYPVAPKAMEYAGNGGSSHVSDPDPFAE